MYMGVVWCGTRKSGKTPPFSGIFQPICMQMCLLHIRTQGQASKHAQSQLQLFIFQHFTHSHHPGVFRYPSGLWCQAG